MPSRPQTLIVILVIVTTQVLGACITDSADADEPSTVGRAATSATDTSQSTRTTSTAEATDTATVPTAQPAETASSTATEPPTPVSAPSEEPAADVTPTTTPIFKLHESDELPAICQGDTVLNIFEKFIQRYNAEDLDGTMALIQADVPGWEFSDEYEMVPLDESGKVEFKWVAMDYPGEDYTGNYGFIARTHEELRSHLAHRFEIDERLQLMELGIGPALTMIESGPRRGTYTSDRNADFGIEFERWNSNYGRHRSDFKGVVDCETGKIIMMQGGGRLPL